jgi:septum formation protein
VVLDGVPLGKPADAAEARQMLVALRGRAHQVVTGVAVVRRGEDIALTGHACTDILMRDYGDDEIEAYIAGGDPLDKAGGYAIQHPGFRPVERIEGCYCNVVGLPLWTVRGLLARAVPALPPRRPDEAYERCTICPLRSS